MKLAGQNTGVCSAAGETAGTSSLAQRLAWSCAVIAFAPAAMALTML